MMRTHDYFFKNEAYIEMTALVDYICEHSSFDVIGVIDDKSNECGCYYNLDSTDPCEFHIGVADLLKCPENDIMPSYLFAKGIVNIFHEYWHAVQTQQCRTLDSLDDSFMTQTVISKYFSYYFPNYYHQNRFNMPHEIDAEKMAIILAKKYIHHIYPRFDFDTALFDYISRLSGWYGPERKRRQGDTTDETLNLLKTWQEDSYTSVLAYKKPSDTALLKMQQRFETDNIALHTREYKLSELCKEYNITDASNIFATGLSYINSNVADVPAAVLENADNFRAEIKKKGGLATGLFRLKKKYMG